MSSIWKTFAYLPHARLWGGLLGDDSDQLLKRRACWIWTFGRVKYRICHSSRSRMVYSGMGISKSSDLVEVYAACRDCRGLRLLGGYLLGGETIRWGDITDLEPRWFGKQVAFFFLDGVTQAGVQQHNLSSLQPLPLDSSDSPTSASQFTGTTVTYHSNWLIFKQLL